jgi:hypothetical protein
VAEIEFRENRQTREAGLLQSAQNRPLLLLAVSLVRLPANPSSSTRWPRDLMAKELKV